VVGIGSPSLNGKGARLRRRPLQRKKSSPENTVTGGAVQYWTDRILAWRYGPAMKALKIMPALIVVFVVAVLTLRKGTIFVP
jgi:hypothetical protein